MRALTTLWIVIILWIAIGMNHVYSDAFKFNLSDADFDHMVNPTTNDPSVQWLIAFLADWCDSCKRFKFELEQFVTNFKNNTHLKVGLVNVDMNPYITSRFIVIRIPSIFHLKENEWRQLEGYYTCANLTDYFSNEEYKSIPSRSSYLDPFSSFAMFLGLVGYIGYLSISFVKHLKETHSTLSLLVILTLCLLLPLVLAWLIFRGGNEKSQRKRTTALPPKSKAASGSTTNSSSRGTATPSGATNGTAATTFGSKGKRPTKT